MRRLTRLALGAGVALGLASLAAPLTAGAGGFPPGTTVWWRRRTRRLRPDRQHRR